MQRSGRVRLVGCVGGPGVHAGVRHVGVGCGRRRAGERTEVQLYVAVLGAWNYTFAGATRTQRVTACILADLGLGPRPPPAPAAPVSPRQLRLPFAD